MLRPPQPAVYLFLLDVSSLAQQSGYLEIACQTISEQLDNLPGDARAQVGFIAFNSAVHFYNIAEGFNQPHEITVLEVDGEFCCCARQGIYEFMNLLNFDFRRVSAMPRQPACEPQRVSRAHQRLASANTKALRDRT